MADKQSVINLAWNLDTSNFDRARTMTDNLKNSLEGLKDPLSGANDAMTKMHDQLSSVKDGYNSIDNVAKSVYNNNRGISDSLRVVHDNSRNIMADYQAMNSKSNDLTETYKTAVINSNQLADSTHRTVIATQQLRQAMLDLNKVHSNSNFKAPSAPELRPSISGSNIIASGLKDHSLRNSVIGGTVAGFVGNGISMLSSYVSNSAKAALQADQNAQKLQLAWQTMGIKSSASIKVLTGQVGELGKIANTNASDVVQTQKNLFNATNGNVNKTKELTNAMFAYGRASGATDQDISSASAGLTRLFNTSKVRGSAFSRIAKQAPYMRNAIIQASGESAKQFMSDMNAGKISGQQLEALMIKSAQNSGQAWEKYGGTAQGALARLQGSQKAIWKATMSGMANETNSGIVQISNLISKNIKPISKMLIGVGNAGAKVLDSAINFLVKNQKPLGSIAQSLVSIVGTIGKAVWGTFSGIVQAIGGAFGLIGGNAKKANNPVQTVANLLKDVASHKKAIEAITTAFAGMFVVNKAMKFAGALKQVALSTGMIKDAESGGKGGILSDILSNGTITGKTLGKRAPQVFEKGFERKPKSAFQFGSSVGKNLENDSLGTFANDSAKSSGLLSKLVSGGGSKLAGLGSKLSSFAGDSKLLTGAKSIASRIPFLDVAMAGTQLIGMNHKNAGGKIGSAGGMLAGTMGGAALGTAILPGVGTAVGGAIGGMAGSSLGKKIGGFVQSHIPKHLFSSIGDQWHKMTDSIGKTADKSLAPVGKAFHQLLNTIHSTFAPVGKVMSSAFKPVGKAFNSMWNTVKPIAKSFGNIMQHTLPVAGKFMSTYLKGTFSELAGIIGTAFKVVGSVLTGALRSFKGIFEVFGGVITGNWSKTWNGLKDIFGGVWDAISGTFKDVFGGIIHSIGNFMGKVGHFIAHPIESIKNGLHLATGTRGGLKNNTHAIVNDGNGREIVQYPNGRMVRPDGTNVHMFLPKGSHVYNAEDTSHIINHHFAGGTRNNGFNNKNESINSNIHVRFEGLNMKSALISTRKYTNQVIQLIKRAYNGINRSSSIELKKMVSQSSLLWKSNNRNTQKSLNELNRQTTNVWKNINHDTNSQQKIIGNTAQKFSKTLTNSLVSGASDMNKQLDKIWTSITSDFNDIFAKLSPYAHSGMNGAIDQLNGGISGINKTLGQFGGNSSVLQPIHYAQGTGAVDHTHLAMVNDAKSGFQDEAILSPDGGVRYAYGRNALTVLNKGESVLNGADTHEAISKGYIPRHASGVGSKKALRALARKNASDYVGAFNDEFTNNIHANGTDLQKGIINTGSSASASDQNGYNWSHAMWAVIHNAMSSIGASATGLLKAVEKAGTGKKYVWGATGPDSFDCSGLVQYALKQMGIDYPRTSGAQIAKAQPISRSQAEPGDLIGNAEHIGVVADNGAHHYFSAFNPSTHPNILMTPVNGTYFPGTPRFGRVGGISHKSNGGSSIKGVSPAMEKLVKSQLGSRALGWLKKTFNDSIGASGNPAGDGVQRWKPDVVKALRALGLSTSSDMVARVLRQINTESSGNPDAIGGTDGLNDGRAMGLMQVKPGTFKAYGKPGLGGWNNGMASIYAGLNYAKHRYGASLSFLGQGHGYARGGRPPLHKPVLVGENGPEIAQFDYPVNIHSNSESKRMVHDLGGISVNPNITINIKGSTSHEDAVKAGKNVKEQILKVLHSIFTDAQIEQAFNV